jgi:hypothetical protein
MATKKHQIALDAKHLTLAGGRQFQEPGAQWPDDRVPALGSFCPAAVLNPKEDTTCLSQLQAIRHLIQVLFHQGRGRAAQV